MPLRHRERGQQRVAELDLDVGALRDQQRVVARLGVVAEEVAHLLRGLQVELVGVELEPLRVVAHRAGLHAEQRVVRFGVVTVHVVAVVGREQRRAHLVRDAHQLRVHLLLLDETVVLELDEERVAPEDRLEPLDELTRVLAVALEERLAHRAAEAAARADQPVAVLLEQLEVHARLREEAVDVGLRRDLDEVLVARGRLGEEGEVEDLVLVTPRAVVAARGDHVGLGADDRA